MHTLKRIQTTLLTLCERHVDFLETVKYLTLFCLKLIFHPYRSGCDHFVQVLSIRKGRKLLSRVIPYMDKEQAMTVVKAILQNFSFLLKREMQDLKKESPEEVSSDDEQLLPEIFF